MEEKLSQLSVLYVEDDELTREVVYEFLAPIVKSVHIATNGTDGFEKYLQYSPDIVITDIQMPLMSGLEMCSRIRASDNKTPVIVTTAFNDAKYLSMAIEAGVSGFITKPVSFDKVASEIAKHAKHVFIEKELHATTNILNQYKNLIDSAAIVSKTDRNGVITYTNKYFCIVSGYTEGELIGQTHNIIRHPDMPDMLFENLWKTVLSKQTWHGIIQNKSKDGSSYWVDTTIAPILDVNGEIQEFISIRFDISELIISKQTIENENTKLEALASVDFLTKAYNRNKLDMISSVEIEHARRYLRPLSIIIVDIDHFKRINDSFGHQVGDSALVELVALLNTKLRSSDFLARWGGEEFVILCPETDKNAAQLLAERLRLGVEENNFRYLGDMTISLGFTEYIDGDTIESMISRADHALYRAKQNGRNKAECE